MDNKSKTDTVTQVLGFIGHHLRVPTITGIHLLGMQTMPQEGYDRTKNSLRHRRPPPAPPESLGDSRLRSDDYIRSGAVDDCHQFGLLSGRDSEFIECLM